jgi:hypothetical protein
MRDLPAAPADAGTRIAAGSPQLVAQNVHFRRDSIGGLWAFGEVVNKGHADASEVGLEIDLYSKANARLARGVSMRVSRNVLPPGGVAVWTTTMSDNPKTWDRVSFRIVEQIGADEIHAANYTQFTVAHVTVKASNPGYSVKVTGTVTNSGTKTAKVANVITAFYDAKGTLLYVDDQGLLYPYASTQILPPGKQASFRSSEITYLKKPARVVVTVRGSTKGADGYYPD